MEAKRDTRVLRYEQVRAKGFAYTRQHLGRLEATGLFPKRVKIGPKRVGWLEHELDGHIEAAAARRKESS
jgi:prophage regulatory protein